MQGVEEYQAVDQAQGLEDLVRVHSGLVLKIARSIKRKLPSHIEMDDLVQSGFTGLIEAAKSFKNDQGATFETYASFRIKGSILDDLRKNSWNSRETMKNLKEMAAAVNKVEQLKMRPATGEEIADAMQISLDDYDKMCQVINAHNISRMGELNENAFTAVDELSPEDTIIHEDLQNRVKSILHTLPEREQILLSLYYIEELTFREISEVLEITEARVCQIHATLLAKISRKI